MSTAPENATEMTFADLGLPDDLLAAITQMGYEVPTPIQAEANSCTFLSFTMSLESLRPGPKDGRIRLTSTCPDRFG